VRTKLSSTSAGRLVRVLPDWRLRSGGIYVVLPSARFRPAKISRFLELLSRVAAGQMSSTD
jgi:DNA-binding transcriptional LysR family regulator